MSEEEKQNNRESVEQTEETSPCETEQKEEVAKQQEEVAKPQEEVTKPQEEVTKPPKSQKISGKEKWIGLAIIVVVLCGAILLQSGIFSTKKPLMPVAYAKNNTLYLSDFKNEPYAITKSLSDGGSYSYYYSAWGVNYTEDAKIIYYVSHVASDGTFQLSRKRVNDDGSQGEVIAENVLDYQMSEDGSVCAYLKAGTPDTLSVYLSTHDEKTLISDNVPMKQGMYYLSRDGRFLAYQEKLEDGILHLCAATADSQEKISLGDQIQSVAFAKKADKLYYVVENDKEYSMHEYQFGGEPKLVADHVTSMNLLPNETDCIYSTSCEKKITLKDVLDDDMAQDDANMVKPDAADPDYQTKLTAYEAKEQRDQMRQTLKNKEWDNPMQNCYLWSKGNATLLAPNILNAVVVGDDSGYVLYSTVDTSSLKKVKLSEVKKTEEVQYLYFGSLMVAPRLTYLVKPGNTAAVVEQTNVTSESFRVSPTEDEIVFQEVDTETGEEKWLSARFQENGTLSDYQELGTQVVNPTFSKDGTSLYYMKASAETLGTLQVVENGTSKKIAEKTGSFRVAEDKNITYFISDINSTTGNGALKQYENGTVTEIDKNVFCLQYKNNGVIVYLKNYDLATQKGDLYYWNGTESKKIDEGISSIFIY